MTMMKARYPGTCASTGRRFKAGATIDYDRATRRAILRDDIEPGEPIGDDQAGAYLASRADAGRYVSNVIRTSGGTFYRNRRGRCEDAPCCGCCTV